MRDITTSMHEYLRCTRHKIDARHHNVVFAFHFLNENAYAEFYFTRSLKVTRINDLLLVGRGLGSTA